MKDRKKKEWVTVSEFEARRKGADYQLTLWVRDCKLNREYLDRWKQQVLVNKSRISVIVQRGGMISLWVNQVA